MFMSRKGSFHLKTTAGHRMICISMCRTNLHGLLMNSEMTCRREKFGVKFSQLTDEAKIKAINEAVPVRISEAEPESIGGN
jgi:hypothetical protein